MKLIAFIIVCLACVASVEATDWTVYRRETFDMPGELSNLEAFGENGWLTAEIHNDASITIGDGTAHFVSHDFSGQALFRITENLPDEYKIQVRLGEVDFSYLEYDDADYANPAFRYTPEGVENGFYWGIISGAKSEAETTEVFWHTHRKIGIDSDDHLYFGEHTETPLYMVYSNGFSFLGQDEVGTAYTPDGNLKSQYISSWKDGGSEWNVSPWNWDVAHVYDDAAWYWAEIERADKFVTLRLYNEDKSELLEAAPIHEEFVYNMGAGETPEEFFYLGDPHVNSYEGNAFVDEIIFYVPTPELAGDFNSDQIVDAADFTVWRDGLGSKYTHDDYETWVANFGRTSTLDVAFVPEPSSLPLITIGLAACLAGRRLSKRRNHRDSTPSYSASR